MSEHRYDWPVEASVLELCDALAVSLRLPDAVRQEPGAIVLVYAPDLSPTDEAIVAATVAEVIGVARVRDLSVTPDEYRALRPFLDALRTFQQMSRSEWMALTAAERERQTFDMLTSLVRVVRAVLRD